MPVPVQDRPGSPSVEPLVSILNDEDPEVRLATVNALVKIGEPSVLPLIKALTNGIGNVRKSASQALAQINDSREVEPMLKALHDGDVEVIAGGYQFFIKRGEKGSETALISAFTKYGEREMALDFLNCRNGLLVDAATKWAHSNGYIIKPRQSGRYGPVWGSGQ